MANHWETDGTYSMGFATAFSLDGGAAGQAVGHAPADHDLLREDGLTVAMASTEGEFELAVRELEADMDYRRVRSGVVVLSQPLASQMLGPVPRELIRKGISVHRSMSSDVRAGATQFVEEFIQARDAALSGLAASHG